MEEETALALWDKRIEQTSVAEFTNKRLLMPKGIKLNRPSSPTFLLLMKNATTQSGKRCGKILYPSLTLFPANLFRRRGRFKLICGCRRKSARELARRTLCVN